MDKVKPSEILILASGAVLLVFSFLDWWEVSGFGGENAWDSFPLLTWPAILGTISAVVLAIQKFASANLPDDVLGFTWPQLHIVAGFVSLLITLGFMITNDADNAIGLFLSLLGAIGLLVGGIMLQNETTGTSAAGPGTTPPSPF